MNSRAHIWTDKTTTEAPKALKSVVEIEQRIYDIGDPDRKSILADIMREEEENLVGRQQAPDSNESEEGIARSSNIALDGAPAASSLKEEKSGQLQRHTVPGPSEPESEIKQSKRKRLKMVFRSRRK